MVTVGFPGGSGGRLKDAVRYCYLAGSDATSHIQEMHAAGLHAICEVVEDVLFGT